MALIDFYKATVSSLGLIYDDDGFLYVPGNKKPTLLLEDGLPLVLPSKEAIDSLFSEDEEGIKITKVLYNPIDENVVKGDNKTLVRTKTIVENRIGYGVMALGSLLLQLANNTKLQNKINSLEVNKFLASLSSVKKQNMKEIVDQKSIDSWLDIYQNYLKSGRDVVEIYLKKSGTYKNTKYNRLATLKHNIYDELIAADQDTPVGGIKLRNKDLATFKLLFEFILEGIDENGVISMGSNDTFSPAFVSLMSIYISIMTRLNNFNRILADVDAEIADSGYVGIEITQEDINNVSGYNVEVKAVPNNMDIERRMKAPEIAAAAIKAPTPTLHQAQAAPAPVQQTLAPQPQPQQQLQPLPYTPQGNGDNSLEAMYARSGIAPAPQGFGMVPQPMMQQPQQMAMMPQQQYGQPAAFPIGMPVTGPVSGYNPTPTFGMGYVTPMGMYR